MERKAEAMVYPRLKEPSNEPHLSRLRNQHQLLRVPLLTSALSYYHHRLYEPSRQIHDHYAEILVQLVSFYLFNSFFKTWESMGPRVEGQSLRNPAYCRAKKTTQPSCSSRNFNCYKLFIRKQQYLATTPPPFSAFRSHKNYSLTI